jgi:GNAT superfamily N-acetyltransferase
MKTGLAVERRASELAAGDVGDVGVMLGSAFIDDPLMNYYFDGSRDRSIPVRKTMTLAAKLTLRYGVGLRLECNGELTGAALLLPPSVRDFPLAAVLSAVLCTPDLWRPRALRRHFGVSDSIAAHRPSIPGWVLLSIGISPAWQHRGHGAWLLQQVLGCVSTSGAICLETHNARNLPLYLRHGFEVTSQFVADRGRGPTTWSMLRAPGAFDLRRPLAHDATGA